MPFKLSPSSLSLFNECPRCFWLSLHGVWKRPEGIFSSLPAGMDRILKRHFDNFRDNNLLPPELQKEKECRGMSLFPDKELLTKWRNNRQGLSWQDSDGNILRGAIDNLLVHKNKLVVLDYKTRGYELKENTHEHYQLQLDVYNFLLRKNGYPTENFAFLLFYVPSEVRSDGAVVFKTTLKKMQVDARRAEKVWQAALRFLAGECPREVCEWCERV
ncbi:hypothetical protein D6817_02875 [Candidatus Pacearchaeota archaeon]|nr:MAG: hypothetical protein D6817_02875 [Candidatus Pacearchaeota archaeon]